MTNKKNYFKQKIYFPDPLLNRALYLDASVRGIQIRHQFILEEMQKSGEKITPELLRSMKNSEEKRRVASNKEFSANMWKRLKEKNNLR